MMTDGVESQKSLGAYGISPPSPPFLPYLSPSLYRLIDGDCVTEGVEGNKG